MERVEKKIRCHICKKPSVTGLCSCKCAVKYYNDQPRKTRKLAKDCARMVGRRSMAEVKFDATFIEGQVKFVKADYEADTFEYRVEETCKYTPDWTLHTRSGKKIYIEFKGVLDGKTRKKMKLIKKQHPKLDIRFIFERASNKIMKTSQTTYGMWADQYGFLWADNILPKEWLR